MNGRNNHERDAWDQLMRIIGFVLLVGLILALAARLEDVWRAASDRTKLAIMVATVVSVNVGGLVLIAATSGETKPETKPKFASDGTVTSQCVGGLHTATDPSTKGTYTDLEPGTYYCEDMRVQDENDLWFSCNAIVTVHPDGTGEGDIDTESCRLGDEP